jgi:hypothetical protein
MLLLNARFAASYARLVRKTQSGAHNAGTGRTSSSLAMLSMSSTKPVLTDAALAPTMTNRTIPVDTSTLFVLLALARDLTSAKFKIFYHDNN